MHIKLSSGSEVIPLPPARLCFPAASRSEGGPVSERPLSPLRSEGGAGVPIWQCRAGLLVASLSTAPGISPAENGHRHLRDVERCNQIFGVRA